MSIEGFDRADSTVGQSCPEYPGNGVILSSTGVFVPFFLFIVAVLMIKLLSHLQVLVFYI